MLSEPLRSTLDSAVQGSLFPQLAEKLTDGVWIFDPNGEVSYANTPLAQMLGYSAGDLVGKNFLDFVFPGDVALARDLLAHTVSGESRAAEYRWRTKSKDYVLTRCNSFPLTTAEGNVKAAVVIVQNVTEQRQLEEAKAHLAAIVESSDDAIASKDLNGIVKTWNKAAERLFGWTSAEMVGSPITKIIPKERLHEEDEILAKLRKGEKVDHFETVRVTKEGKPVNVSVTISPIRDSNGTIVGASKVARDISIDLHAQEIRNRLAAIVESSDDAIISKDLNGVVQSWNKGAERIFGYTEQEMIGQPITKLFPEDRKGEEKLILDRLSKGYRIEHYETVRMTKDGRLLDVSVTVSPIRDASGKVVAASKVARDVTESKRAADALRHNQEELRKLNLELEERVRERTAELEAANKEMEGFTYSVSHDLRAPLRAVVSSSMILLEDYGDKLPEEAGYQLERQALAAKKLAVLIDELLQLSRLSRTEIHRKTIDMTAIAEEIGGELSVAHDSCVHFEIQPGLRANGDSRLVRLLLANLMDNARKFSPEGGSVVFGAMRHDGLTTFYVKDEGIGFDMKYAHKLFLPFERLVTDEDFPGTGIGLANVKRIVERHGGMIRAESELGKGSVFYFTLEPDPKAK